MLLTRNAVHGLEIVGSKEVVVVCAEVRDRVGGASVFELGVTVIVHAVVPFAHKDTGVVLILLAKVELIVSVGKGVLDITPLL